MLTNTDALCNSLERVCKLNENSRSLRVDVYDKFKPRQKPLQINCYPRHQPKIPQSAFKKVNKIRNYN